MGREGRMGLWEMGWDVVLGKRGCGKRGESGKKLKGGRGERVIRSWGLGRGRNMAVGKRRGRDGTVGNREEGGIRM